MKIKQKKPSGSSDEVKKQTFKMFSHSNSSPFKQWKRKVFYRIAYCEILELISHDRKLLEEYKTMYIKGNVIDFINSLKIEVDINEKVKLVKK